MDTTGRGQELPSLASALDQPLVSVFWYTKTGLVKRGHQLHGNKLFSRLIGKLPIMNELRVSPGQ